MMLKKGNNYLRIISRGVAQLGRASVSGAEDCGFKSRLPDSFNKSYLILWCPF